MKPRRVLITMEVETDAPLRELHLKIWKDSRTLITDDAIYNFRVLKISAKGKEGKK
jgi:hypothetical protein